MPRRRRVLPATPWLVLVGALAGGALGWGMLPAAPARAAAADDLGAAFFERDVWPVLQQHCVKCHGGEKTKGGLRLTSRAAVLSGGEHGPAAVPGDAGKSLILKAVGYKDDDLQMPPRERLADREIALLTRWVERGLPWPPGIGDSAAALPATAPPTGPRPGVVTEEAKRFWSFRPVRRPPVPAVKDASRLRTPIDAFVQAKLEAAGLTMSAPAAKTALLRRAYYDLVGLPPSPAEVDAFLKDDSPDAYEKVVDRLLATPQYGEKWARHWLDVVRFAETNSFERDAAKPNAWRYRDYVIRSLNADKPYDQFVREQVAGDELDQVTTDSIIATGFYRLGPWDDEPTDRLQAKYDDLDDIVTTTGQAFLGLTINCARCHDHKIDPIPQKDYYRLLAFFHNIAPYQTSGPNILTPIGAPAERKAAEEEQKAQEQRKDDLRRRIDDFERPVLKGLTEAEREKIKKPRLREEVLAPKIAAATNVDEVKHYRDLWADLRELEKRKPTDLPQALSVKENGPSAPPTFVLIRGNAASRGDEVQPAFPGVLSPPEPKIAPPSAARKTTGRRRALAEWLASRDNPLTARVMANRIWQHHFGRGIVRSPNDFGLGGDKPTHPELLDWLASELMQQGWRLKPIHRLIMTSAAYRMSSVASPEALARDPLNDHLWRFDMRRLSAEELRDSILAVNGRLNLKMYGPGIFPTIPQAILAGQSRPGSGWGNSSPEEQARRSVYIHVKRSLAVPMISSFDAPDTDFSCPARFTTTQSTQALMMLNSEALNDEAKAFAARLKREAGASPEAQVRLALKLIWAREPADAEINRGVKFMKTLREKHGATPDIALEQFALMSLNLNEFVYLD